MYSNYITPPDFVSEVKHTVTIVDALVDEIETLCKITENSNEDFNIYLYRSEMNNQAWLDQAVEKSEAVIINLNNSKQFDLCKRSNAYYYGPAVFLSPAIKINSLFEYFQKRQFKDK